MFRTAASQRRWEQFKAELDQQTSRHPDMRIQIQLLQPPNGAEELTALDAHYVIDGSSFVRTFPNLPLLPNAESILPQGSDNTIDGLCDRLGAFAIEQLADNWQVVCFTAHLDDVSGLTTGRFQRVAEDGLWLSFTTDYRIYFICDALRKLFHTLSGQAWQTTEVTLTNIGECTLRFEYGD
jgi:hypothetical protein